LTFSYSFLECIKHSPETLVAQEVILFKSG